MVLREQRDRVGLERVVTGVVRVRRRIVTETRQVEVTVRREVLEVDPPVAPGTTGDEVFDIDADSGNRRGAGGSDRDVLLDLRAEFPIVGIEVRAVERVRIGVRRVPGAAEVVTTTEREQIEITDPRS